MMTDKKQKVKINPEPAQIARVSEADGGVAMELSAHCVVREACDVKRRVAC